MPSSGSGPAVTFPTTTGQPELPEDWDEPHVEELIRGAIDTHTHPFPSPFPRRMGILELARDAAAAGYRAIVIKGHHHSMVPEILALTAEAGLGDIPVRVFSGSPTNNSVGGLNPAAVELSLAMGGRWVWMPTLSSVAHIEHHEQRVRKGDTAFQKVTLGLRDERPISVFDDSGRLKPEVTEICELIAQYDVVLCGGHLSAREFDAVAIEAQRVGVQRIICSHPAHVVGADFAMAAEWARRGIYIEHAVAMYGEPFPGRTPGKRDFAELERYIAEVGPSNTVLVSDTGQMGRERPVNAMRGAIRQLIRAGYSDADIRTMTGGAAAELLLRQDERNER